MPPESPAGHAKRIAREALPCDCKGPDESREWHLTKCHIYLRPAVEAAILPLVEALVPFARAADEIGEHGEPELVHIWAAIDVGGGEVGDWVSSDLRQSDLLNAAKALAGGKDEPS